MLKSVLITALALLGPACAQESETFTNPILYEDFPDNDISLGPDGAFYYSASNFHYSPAAPILRSYDLVDWEFVGHSIPRQNFGDGYNLPPTGERAYRGGTWASTLRYRESTGLWYWIGCVNFYHTWVYTAPNPEGPWTNAGNYGNGVCFYDNGLLIDDDDTMYIVYSFNDGKQVNVTQLAPDGLSTVRTEKVIEPGQVSVDSIEGNRMYKFNGFYYILNDHPGSTAYVWKSESPWGPYEGKPLADNVQSPLPGGGAPHQGSLIETPQGDWYFMSFTWAFPSGRLPVLAPIEWQDDGFPTLVTDATTGAWGTSYPLPLPRKPLNHSWASTNYPFTTLTTLPPTFEWNHNPDTDSFTLTPDVGLVLSTATANETDDLYSARNTLTHRVHGEFPTATLELDVGGMADGDRAGLAAFRDRSAYIGAHRTGDELQVVARFNMTLDEWGGPTLDLGEVVETVPLGAFGEVGTRLWFRLSMDVRPDGAHEAGFEYSVDGEAFVAVGGKYELYTGWAFFLGYRFGIFNYATKALGGSVTAVSFATGSK